MVLQDDRVFANVEFGWVVKVAETDKQYEELIGQTGESERRHVANQKMPCLPTSPPTS